MLNKDTIKDIIREVLAYGFGALMIIAGILFITFHKYLDIEFPWYMIIGLIIIILGTILFIIEFHYKNKRKLIRLKNEHEINMMKNKK